MNLFKFPRCALLFALLLLPFVPGHAQAPAGTRPANSDVMSLDFPGGPLSKLVASLNAEQPSKLSIIQTAGLDPVLPAFSVREVRVDAVVAALGRLLEAQGYFLNPTGHNLAVLGKIEHRRTEAFTSLQLEDKIGPRTTEDIIAAIQQGCEFANEGKPSTLRFKYHPGTKLLFVAGAEQEVEIARRVFGSLPDASRPKVPLSASDKK